MTGLIIMIVDIVNKILATGIIVSQIGILFSVIYFIFFRREQNSVTRFLAKYGMLFAFLIALISTLGSLFYSMVAGFDPCELCWFQRIFMYPEVILLGIALIKKDKHIINYALTLSFFGGAISLYHNYMYYYAGGLNVFCQLSGVQVSCIKRYVFEFGYVTIPMMALTAFLLIIMFLMFSKKLDKELK